MEKQILILHGANLNMLGKREPHIYGKDSLEEINQRLLEHGAALGLQVHFTQSNHEGVLVDTLQEAADWASGVVFNPGGYTHTSVVLSDAVTSIGIPVVEVHLSNIQSREEFRKRSLIAPVSAGSIAGFGWYSYVLGMQALSRIISNG